MANIKYQCTPLKNVGFLFEILEQSPDITQRKFSPSSSDELYYEATNGWLVTSVEKPSIDTDRRIISLRGYDKYKDTIPVAVLARSAKDASIIEDEIAEAITEFIEEAKPLGVRQNVDSGEAKVYEMTDEV